MSLSISLLDLPQDILVTIFKKLKVSDLKNLIIACSALRSLIVNDNVLWRYIFNGYLVINARPKRYRELSWYDKYRISHNWSYGIYRSRVAIDNNEKYIPWMQYACDDLLLSVGSELRCYSLDKKGINNLLWKVQVPKVERHDVRTNDISRFSVLGDLVACGNRDGCVAVYKINNKSGPKFCWHIKDCHQNGHLEVSAVEMINSQTPLIVTVSHNHTKLKLWTLPQIYERYSQFQTNQYEVHDIQSRASKVIDIGNVNGLRCLAVNDKQYKLAVGPNGNPAPVLIDLEICKQVWDHNGSLNSKYAIRDIIWHDDNVVAYGTHSGHLLAMDTRLGKVVYEATDPFLSPLYCVRSDGGRALVAGAAEYARCSLFDLRRPKQHVQIYFTQQRCSPVYCLEFDTTKLIAAADKSVATINFNVSVGAARRKDYSHVFEVVNR